MVHCPWYTKSWDSVPSIPALATACSRDDPDKRFCGSGGRHIQRQEPQQGSVHQNDSPAGGWQGAGQHLAQVLADVAAQQAPAICRTPCLGSHMLLVS